MDCADDYQALCDRLRFLPRPARVGVEGFSGSGKSKLSQDLGGDLKAGVIHTDNFVTVGDESLSYPDRLDYKRIATDIEDAGSTKSLILVEGICLRDVLRRLNLSVDFFVYVKRIAGNGLWHDGFHLEDFEAGDGIEENNEEPHRSDFAYHAAERPHERADLLFKRIDTDDYL